MNIESKAFDGYAEIKLSGEFSNQIIREQFALVLEQPWWKPGQGIIWDARELGVDAIDGAVVEDMGRLRREFLPQRGVGPSACVVSQSLAFGLSRMFGLSYEMEMPAGFATYYDVDEARRWMRDKLAKRQRVATSA